MKVGFRKFSLKGRIAACMSVKRYVRHSLGVKMPRGMGVITSPKRFFYNKAYYRLTASPYSLSSPTSIEVSPNRATRGQLQALSGIESITFWERWSKPVLMGVILLAYAFSALKWGCALPLLLCIATYLTYVLLGGKNQCPNETRGRLNEIG